MLRMERDENLAWLDAPPPEAEKPISIAELAGDSGLAEGRAVWGSPKMPEMLKGESG